MEKYNMHHWFDFLDKIQSDPRINVWHIALFIAIARLGYQQNEYRIIRVSRSKLMALSHITTITSYHKYFKHLQDFGYIQYTPSYHPDYRSTVEILKTQEK